MRRRIHYRERASPVCAIFGNSGDSYVEMYVYYSKIRFKYVKIARYYLSDSKCSYYLLSFDLIIIIEHDL